MYEIISWELLATISGAGVIVACLTQLIKRKIKINPKTISLILATIIVTMASLALGNLNSWQDIAIILLKSSVIAFAACGEYELVKDFFKK